MPELFASDIKDKCIANCSHPDDPNFNTWCCTTLCIFEEIEIAKDGHFDNEKAKEVLTSAFKSNGKILKVLDGIVDSCEKQGKYQVIESSRGHSDATTFHISASDVELKPTTADAGKAECATPQYGFILSCIHRDLFKVCPEVKKDAECKEIKEFMEKCPSKTPPLKQNQQNHTRVAKDNLADAIKNIIKDKDKEKSD